ncbi:transcriptional regulator [Pseudomonas sp. NPDC007930]|uniref:transcriptional regulator n=1 Tax=Pseudomonas sp. NPDC007930 TaxID=3364417 RepID=UPI0036EAC953
MATQVVFDAALALQLDGLVMGERTPFGKAHFNGCFAEIEALFQRAGYHRGLDVVGYDGQLYALFDPARWEAVAVLRLLKQACDAREAGAGVH